MNATHRTHGTDGHPHRPSDTNSTYAELPEGHRWARCIECGKDIAPLDMMPDTEETTDETIEELYPI